MKLAKNWYGIWLCFQLLKKEQGKRSVRSFWTISGSNVSLTIQSWDPVASKLSWNGEKSMSVTVSECAYSKGIFFGFLPQSLIGSIAKFEPDKLEEIHWVSLVGGRVTCEKKFGETNSRLSFRVLD